MLWRFYAFGDDLPRESGAETDHAFDQGQITGVVEQVGDKAAVDLERIGRDVAQMGERNVQLGLRLTY